jgi:hypothetical protein
MSVDDVKDDELDEFDDKYETLSYVIHSNHV